MRSFIKKTFCFLFFICLTAPNSFAQQKSKFDPLWEDGVIKVYMMPSEDTSVLTTVKDKKDIIVLKEKGYWYKVNVGGLIGWVKNKKYKTPTASSSPRLKITKGGYYASVSKKILERFIDFCVVKDYEAANKLVQAHLVFPLKSGLKVYVEDMTWTGLIKIRPQGSTVCVWTVVEAVK